MTQVMAPPCERCGGMLPPYALVCTRCGALAHRAELERLSQEAVALEPYDPAGGRGAVAAVSGAAAAGRAAVRRDLPPPRRAHRRRPGCIPATRVSRAHRRLPRPRRTRAQPAARTPPPDTLGTALLKTGGSMLISILVYAVLFARRRLAPARARVRHRVRRADPHPRARPRRGDAVLRPQREPADLHPVPRRPDQPPPAAAEREGGSRRRHRRPDRRHRRGASPSTRCTSQLPDGSGLAKLTKLLAYVGFLLNLFNLLPVPPLDGGRITAAVSPKVWMLGIAGLIGIMVQQYTRTGQFPFSAAAGAVVRLSRA